MVAAALVVSFVVAGCSADSSGSSGDEGAGASDSTASSSTAGSGDEPEVGGGANADDGADEADSAGDTTGETDDASVEPVREDADDYLRAAAEVLRDGGDPAEMAEVATGTALDAALARAAEFEDNGWHQVGVPRIVSTTMVEDDRDADPPRMVVLACVDSSDVDVVDEDGTSVRQGAYADRSRMLFTLVREDDEWLVARESFPNNPNC